MMNRPLAPLLRAAGLPLPADPISISGLCADTRQLAPGMLFAALPGVAADGISYLVEAQAKGAAAALVPAGAPVPDGLSLPLVRVDNVRRALAGLAAAFYDAQPERVVAVTGTNGKSSVVEFCRQLWQGLGHPAASLGTLGFQGPHAGAVPAGGLTTADPVTLHARLAQAAAAGVRRLALEASSHGLDQYRLDGVRIAAAAFTNLTRDHLDYHGTMAAYAAAKRRLFTELLPRGETAVLHAQLAAFSDLRDELTLRGVRVWSYGTPTAELALLQQTPVAGGQDIRLRVLGREHACALPLAGAFQAENVLAALGLVLAVEGDAALDALLAQLPALTGVRGRLERVAQTASGAAVYVDYAHTPDALETALRALRPHTSGALAVVFGCGGNRDAGKRPLMGAVAERHADRVIITDDNPRFEDPASIRAAIAAACPKAQNIGEREAALCAALGALQRGDVLLVAGKGHETTQTVGHDVRPFDDAAIIHSLLLKGAAA